MYSLNSTRRLLYTVPVLILGELCWAQQTVAPVTSPVSAVSDDQAQTDPHRPSQSKWDGVSGYVLGPGDHVLVRAVGVEEFTDKSLAIDLDGQVRFPLIGVMTLAGFTTEQAASEIAKRLQDFVLHPDVTVSVAEFRSQPVSVIGAVRTPGIQQVQGQKTLLEMLSLAGGVDASTAGSVIKITRRLEWGPIPIPGASNDPTMQFSVAQVSIKSLLDAKNPEQNVPVKPYDVISVPRGETVYVIGEVLKAGGFLLNDGEQITVLKALSMAGGADRMAQLQHARILRRVSGETSRAEVPVNLNNILEGKTDDVRMQPEDILFVPNNVPKRAAIRMIEAAIQMGTGIAIFRP